MQKEIKKGERGIGKRVRIEFGKKGEITSEQTVKFVLPVLAFLIVLGFLVYLGFKEAAQEDICHLSVLSRGTSPESAQALIPLKCSTKKVCLTNRGGKCEDSLAGEQEIEVVKLPKVRDVEDSENIRKAARVIEEVSAEEMYNCWKMMGEGKIDIFGKFYEKLGLDYTKSSCVICSRVAIDKDISESILREIDIHRFMKENQVPDGDLTYLQAFTDRGVNSYSKVDESYLKSKLNLEDNNIIGEHDTRETAIVFMQIKSEKFGDAIKNLGTIGLTVAGSAFITPGVSSLAKRLILTPQALIGALGAAAVASSYVAYNTYEGRTAAAGYCGEFSTTDEKAKEGCSLVQIMPYDFQEVNKLCASIQGMP